jgi:hypothetical protein
MSKDALVFHVRVRVRVLVLVLVLVLVPVQPNRKEVRIQEAYQLRRAARSRPPRQNPLPHSRYGSVPLILGMQNCKPTQVHDLTISPFLSKH